MNSREFSKKTLPGTGGAEKRGKINLPPVYLQAFVLFFRLH